MKSIGFALCLAPPLILFGSLSLGWVWAIPVLFFLVTPFAPLLFGRERPGQEDLPIKPNWLLTALPVAYVLIWLTSCVWVYSHLGDLLAGTWDTVAVWLSVWVVGSLGATVGHELIHRHDALRRRAGRLLFCSLGYFHFPEEHKLHHAHSRQARDDPDFGLAGESIYRFFLRRVPRTYRDAAMWEEGRVAKGRRGPWSSRLYWGSAVTMGFAGLAYALAGPTGLVFYLSQAIGILFTVSVITFVQHWGFNANSPMVIFDNGSSWQHTCVLQNWLTLT